MVQCLYEENGRYRIIDSRTGMLSDTPKEPAQLLSELGRGTSLKLCADLSVFSLRKTVLPDLDRAKIKEILPFELEGMFMSPSSELILDFCPLRQTEDGMECLVFAISRVAAEKYMAPLVSAGLNMVSLGPAWDESLLKAGISKEDFDKAELNLAPAGLKAEKSRRTARHIFRTAFIYAASALLVFIAGLSVRYYLVLKMEADMKKQISVAYTSLFPEQKMPPDIYYGIQSKLVELRQNYKTFRGTDALGILRSVSGSMRDGIRIKEIVMEGSKAVLKGEGAQGQQAALEQFRSALKKDFSSAQLLETRSLTDGKTAFVIEVTVYE